MSVQRYHPQSHEHVGRLAKILYHPTVFFCPDTETLHLPKQIVFKPMIILLFHTFTHVLWILSQQLERLGAVRGVKNHTFQPWPEAIQAARTSMQPSVADVCNSTAAERVPWLGMILAESLGL